MAKIQNQAVTEVNELTDGLGSRGKLAVLEHLLGALSDKDLSKLPADTRARLLSILPSTNGDKTESATEAEKIHRRGFFTRGITEDRYLEVIQLANKEAQQLFHPYIGTEHLLLALTKDGSQGDGAKVLKNLGLELSTIQLEVKKIVEQGPEYAADDKLQLPLTARSKMVCNFAKEECRKLNHDNLGPEHMLIGMHLQQESVAGMVLSSLGVTLESLRKEAVKLHME